MNKSLKSLLLLVAVSWMGVSLADNLLGLPPVPNPPENPAAINQWHGPGDDARQVDRHVVVRGQLVSASTQLIDGCADPVSSTGKEPERVERL